MNNILTYNQYLNESVKDLMKGKSEEQVKDATEILFDQLANYLLDMDEFNDYLDAYNEVVKYEELIVDMRKDGDSIEMIANRLIYGRNFDDMSYDENVNDDEETNESVRDLMKGKTDEEIDKIRKSGKFLGKIYTGGYPIEEIKNVIKKHSDKFNEFFIEKNQKRNFKEWSYNWDIPSNNKDEFILELELYKTESKYAITFRDNRIISLLKLKHSFQKDTLYHQFIVEFEFLEDALNFLNSCGIDTKKITRE